MNQLDIHSYSYIKPNTSKQQQPVAKYPGFTQIDSLNHQMASHQLDSHQIKKLYIDRVSVEKGMQWMVLWQLEFPHQEIKRILNETPSRISVDSRVHNESHGIKRKMTDMCIQADGLDHRRYSWIIKKNDHDAGDALSDTFMNSIKSMQTINKRGKVVGLFFQTLTEPHKEMGCITHYVEKHSEIPVPRDGAIVKALNNMSGEEISMTRYVVTFGKCQIDCKIIEATKHIVKVTLLLNKQGAYKTNDNQTHARTLFGKKTISKKPTKSHCVTILLNPFKTMIGVMKCSIEKTMKIMILWQLQYVPEAVMHKETANVDYISKNDTLNQSHTNTADLLMQATELEDQRTVWMQTKTSGDYDAHVLSKAFKKAIESIEIMEDRDVFNSAVRGNTQVIGLFFQKLNEAGKTEQGDAIGCITNHSNVISFSNDGVCVQKLKNMGKHIKMTRCVAILGGSTTNRKRVEQTNDIVEIKPALNGQGSPYQINQTDTRALSGKDPKQSSYLPIFLVSSTSEVPLIQGKQQAGRYSLAPSRHMDRCVPPKKRYLQFGAPLTQGKEQADRF